MEEGIITDLKIQASASVEPGWNDGDSGVSDATCAPGSSLWSSLQPGSMSNVNSNNNDNNDNVNRYASEPLRSNHCSHTSDLAVASSSGALRENSFAVGWASRSVSSPVQSPTKNTAGEDANIVHVLTLLSHSMGAYEGRLTDPVMHQSAGPGPEKHNAESELTEGSKGQSVDWREPFHVNRVELAAQPAVENKSMSMQELRGAVSRGYNRSIGRLSPKSPRSIQINKTFLACFQAERQSEM